MERSHCSGLSMVELLVSMALGVVLGLVAAFAYVQAKHHFFVQRQVAQVQDSGRHALRLLGRELAASGFFGGLPVAQAPLLAPPGEGCVDGWALDLSATLAVIDDVGGQAPAESPLDDCLNWAAVLPGTDVLAVKRTAGEASVDGGDVALGLAASATRRWYLRVNDTGRARWEQHSAAALMSLEAGPGVTYWRAMAGVYFVRPWSVSEGDGIPTLCVDALAGGVMAVRCLVEGVEDLQLQFGFDTDGDGIANRWGSADVSNDVATAVSSRIFLLLRSIDALPGGAQRTRYMLGDKITDAPADGYLREVMATTVALGSRRVPLG